MNLFLGGELLTQLMAGVNELDLGRIHLALDFPLGSAGDFSDRGVSLDHDCIHLGFLRPGVGNFPLFIQA